MYFETEGIISTRYLTFFMRTPWRLSSSWLSRSCRFLILKP